MFPIQIAALLMTMVRKSIISAGAWHYYYTLSLLSNYVVGPIAGWFNPAGNLTFEEAFIFFIFIIIIIIIIIFIIISIFTFVFIPCLSNYLFLLILEAPYISFTFFCPVSFCCYLHPFCFQHDSLYWVYYSDLNEMGKRRRFF